MTPETIERLGRRIVGMIADEFSHPSRRPVFPPPRTQASMDAVFGGPAPQDGIEPERLLDILRDHLLPSAGNPNHPRLMAYVLTASDPLSALAESLVAAIKLRPTTWRNQPASCHIETTVVRWLGDMVGFSDNAAGYMTTGGSWANLVALNVARARKAGWDVREEGVHGHAPLTAYISADTHSCLQRSAELLGMGSRWLRKIPVGPSGVSIDLIERAIETDLAAGCRPFCIVGNAGTVDIGAVVPLAALAVLARRYDLWLHVDGAYGAFAALVPEMKPLFAGLSQADSLTLDPHKWLNTPFEAGCILFRNWEDLGCAFSLTPAYLRAAMGSGCEEHNQYDYGFELSRTDRALKVWLALRGHGFRHYANLVAHHLELARFLARLVSESEDFELLAPPVLSICCFRFVPRELKSRAEAHADYLNQLNYSIEMALMRDGRALVSGTDRNGVRVLRACIASHAVTRTAVEETLALLREFGCRLHAEGAAAWPVSPFPPLQPSENRHLPRQPLVS